MDDNNLQDLFNLGSDDSASTDSNTPKDANPNVAPLDDFFNSVAPLSSTPKQNEINSAAAPSEPSVAPSVSDTVNNVAQNVDSAINQTMDSVNAGVDQFAEPLKSANNVAQNFESTIDQGFNSLNQTMDSVNNGINQVTEPMHSEINTNPMQTTLTENSVNPGQYTSSIPQEPDPMLEHMAENNMPGADLNNAFSSNQGGFSSPNPSDVYKNSAAMNYANNAQSQVNFNQQQQNNMGGYSTKKKTNPFLVILLILLIVAVIGVLGYFIYITLFTKKDNSNSNTNQNTVTPVVNDLPDTYQYLSDIDSLSSASKAKLEEQDEYALINSNHGVLTQSTNPLALNFAVDGEYFVLDVNKNEDMHFVDIKVPVIQENDSDEILFYYINSNLEFVKGTITITDLTGYDLIKTDESFETVTSNLWDLFYNDSELDGFYKLNDRYFLKLHLEDKNLTSIDEEELKDLLDSIILDFSVSTDDTPTDNNPYRYLNGYVKLDESKYKNLELDGKFSLNLVDSLYITSWTINKTDNANVITALTKDDSYNIQIVELENPIEDIDNLASELSKDYKASQTLFAQYTDDNGVSLDVPVIADSNGNLLGIAVESEETCYLFLIAGSSIESGTYATTYVSQDDFLNQMTYLFKNVIVYSSTEDENQTTPSAPTRPEDDDEDEDENENTNVVDDTNTNESTNTNSNSNTNTNTNTNTTNEVEEDEDEEEETENTNANTNSNTNNRRNTSTRN